MSRSGCAYRGVLLGLVMSAAGASAAEPTALRGFELERLELNPGAEGALLLGTGELLPAGQWRFSVAGQYQQNPLVLAQGTEVYPIVGNRVTTYLAGAYSLTSWLELGAQLPLVALQRGADLSSQGLLRPSAYGLATPSVAARWALASQQEGKPVDVALGLELGLPVGSTSGFSRDDGLRYNPQLMVGRRFNRFRLALEAQVLVRPRLAASEDALIKQPEVGNELRFGAVAATMGRRLRWELEALGAVPLVKQTGSVEVLAGPRYLAGRSTELFALAGVGVGSTPGTPLFRVLVGSAWGDVTPPVRSGGIDPLCDAGWLKGEKCPDLDDDHDGIPNKVDKCIDTPGDASRKGCPFKDSDGDGIEDLLDNCPMVWGGPKWGGCPMPDQDGDGVEDSEDVCPNEKGTAERKGCPNKDRDEDGVQDDEDSCPNEKGLAKFHGCPDWDPDGDKIPNSRDTCPNEPGPVANNGCPEYSRSLIHIASTRFVLSGRVLFLPGQTVLDVAACSQLLDQLARAIIEHPGFSRVRVGAHTDNRTSAEESLRLTQARADSVREYLIHKGVPPGQLEAVGYGDTLMSDTKDPYFMNDTAIGRENNRWVEFVIVSPAQDSEPNGGASP